MTTPAVPGSRYNASTIARITVSNGPLTGTVREAVIQASVSWSAIEAATFSLQVVDSEDLSLLRDGFLDLNTVITWDDPAPSERIFKVIRRGLADSGGVPVISATGQLFQVADLRTRKGAHTWSNMSPTDVVWAEVASAGCRQGLMEPTPRRKTITRVKDGQTDESSWDLCNRLAEETGSMFFIHGGLVYFGRPTWLADRMPWMTIKRADIAQWATGTPGFSETSIDKDQGATCTLNVLREKADLFMPGVVVVFSGYGPYDRAYMVQGVGVELDDLTAAGVSLVAPVDPVVNDPALANKPTQSGLRWKLTYPTVTTAPDNGEPPDLSRRVLLAGLSFAQIDHLFALGWFNDPNDGVEALYPPGRAGKLAIWPVAGQVRSSNVDGTMIYADPGASVYAPISGRVNAVSAGTPSTIDFVAPGGWTIRLSNVAKCSLKRGQSVRRGVNIGEVPLPAAAGIDPSIRMQGFRIFTPLDLLQTDLLPVPKGGS